MVGLRFRIGDGRLAAEAPSAAYRCATLLRLARLESGSNGRARGGRRASRANVVAALRGKGPVGGGSRYLGAVNAS